MASTPSAQRPLWLVKLKGQPGRRGHMMVYIPNVSCADHHPTTEGPSTGTVLQVVGAPMLGYAHEFIRNYNINITSGDPTVALVGKVDTKYIRDPPTTDSEKAEEPNDPNLLEGIASRIAPPRKTENFLDPAQASEIRDCQNWVLDFVTELVRRGILPDDAQAIGIVKGNTDVQTGLALRSVNSLMAPVGPRAAAAAVQTGAPSDAQRDRELREGSLQRGRWVWDEGEGKWTRHMELGKGRQ